MAKTSAVLALEKLIEDSKVDMKIQTLSEAKGQNNNSAPSSPSSSVTSSSQDTTSSDTTRASDYNDYASAVKYLNDKGYEGASGIMTQSEWRRRRGKDGGTYQDYLKRAVGKFESGSIQKSIDSAKSYTYKSNNSNKSYGEDKTSTSFGTELNNTYSDAKNKVTTKNTITSDLSDDERKKRIDEINKELKQLNINLDGYARAKSYTPAGLQKNLQTKYDEAKARKAELVEELKTLERVGSFSSSEMLQWKIDDAKAEADALKQKLPAGGRISPAQAEVYKENALAYNRALSEIEELEREKAMYDDIAKFSNVVNKDTFGGQTKANYRSTKLSEKASIAFNDYMNNPTEKNRERAFTYYALAEEYIKNNKYALDEEGRVLSLLSKNFASNIAQKEGQLLNQLIGGGIGTMIGGKAGWTTGSAIGSGVHSYNVIRGSVFSELLSYGIDEETARKMANDDALIESIIEGAETAKDWAFMLYGGVSSKLGNGATKVLGKVTNKAASSAAKWAAHPLINLGLNIGKGTLLNSGSEYLEEGLQGAVSRATRERAWALLDKEIGQYGEGTIDLYDRPIYKNPDGTISTVASATIEIDGEFVLLPTIVRGEDGKAKSLKTVEEIVEQYEKTGDYLGKFDTAEEAEKYAIKLHYAQEYRYSDNTSTKASDNAFVGSVKVLGDAIFGGNTEAASELHEQGVEGFKTGLVSGGIQGTPRYVVSAFRSADSIKEQNMIADAVLEDEETLDALIEEGKASGEGTVSEKIATEIEETKAKGKEVTRAQVKSLIASNDVYIANEENTTETETLEQAAKEVVEKKSASKPLSTVQAAEELSKSGARLTVEEAKQASGYGDAGAKVLANLVNSTEGKSFSQVKSDMHTSYLAGLSNKTIKSEGSINMEAYLAGKSDREMSKVKATEGIFNNKVYNSIESGLITPESKNKGNLNPVAVPKSVSPKMVKALDLVGKALGRKVMFVESITVNGQADAANAQMRSDGVFEISVKAEQPLYELLFHEPLHIMRQENTAEYHAFVDFAVQHAEYLDLRLDVGDSRGTKFEGNLAQYQQHGLSLEYDANIEEIAARFAEKLARGDRDAIRLIEKMAQNSETRTAVQKFVDTLKDIIDKCVELWKRLKKQGEYAAAEELGITISDLKKAKELYAKALTATAENAQKRASEQKAEKSSENLENQGNKEYNGSTDYSLKRKTTYNEYNTMGMKWAYSSSTQIGDRKVLYKARIGKFVLVEATKEDVGFIELKSGTHEQLREDEKLYESNKQGEFADNERDIDKAIHNFESGQNDNTRNNVDVGNRGEGIQNAEVSEGKSKSNGTADTQTTDGILVGKSFSLKKNVEETKDLIAVHNVWEHKLRQALELGGLPSPSIAITKKDFSHDNFGDISLVFRKDTISPTDRRNKVYGGDAYTPTRQVIDYKINDKALDKVEERVNKLIDKDIRYEFRLFLDNSNMEVELTQNNGNFVEAYKRNEALKIAFLKDNEIPFKPVMKAKEISRYADNIVLRRVARALGDETLKNAQKDSKVRSEVEPMVRKLLNDRMKEQGAPRIYTEQIDLFELDNILMAASEYIREGERKTVDYYATKDKLEKKFTKKLTAEYEKWLAELGGDIVEKKGIRNDRDLFTPSGNRRSFEALHWDYTLENVVKSMNEKQSKGSAFWGGNVFGASTKEYESIADIKADSSRLQEMTDEEYEALKSEYKDRLDDIANAYSNGKSYYDAEETLIEAIATKKTKQGIRSYLAQFNYVYKVTDDIVNDLWELRNDIAQMPVSYFEAKPQRAVGFNEVAAAIIPRTKDKSLKAELESKGINVLEYDKSKEGDRLKKINSVPNASFSLKRTTNLSNKDTKELLDIIGHLKSEFEVTKFAKADPKKLAKMTKDILKEYSSQADLDATTKAVDELYQYLANGEDGHPAAWNEVYSKAYEIADNIVGKALVVDNELYNEYSNLRQYLRTTPMKFNSERDSVPSGYDNFRDFRRRNWGRLNFTKDGMGVDSIYQELSDLYPEFFNADEQLTIEDMLARIVDVLDEIQPTEVNPYSSEMQEMTSFVANDIIDRFFDVPQAKPTFADKAERRVAEARIAGGKKVEAVRQQKDEKIQKLNEKAKADKAEAVNAVRQHRDEKIQKLIDKQRAKTKNLLEKAKTKKAEAVNKERAKREKAISNMKESQKAKVLRAQIMRHANDLSQKLLKPSDNKHVPENLRGLVAKVLECINLESNYTYDPETRTYKKTDDGLPTRRTEAFKELRDVYTQMASTLTIDPDLMGDDGLISEITGLASKRIVDMNSTELQTVWKTICAVEASISTANKMFSKGKFDTILEAAEKLWDDNNGKKGTYYGKVKKLLNVDMLTPETFFHYLGDAGDSIFRMMRDAQDKHISIMKEVADFTHKSLKGVKVNSLEKTIHTVTLGGEEVKLSTAQLMELYVLMKRKQAIDHIFKGGILPDIIAKKKKLTRAEPIRNISMGEITEALSNLTDDQKKIADKLQKYVSTVLSEYGNEASMQVYNYKKFNEQNYWTIRTNKQDVQSDVGKDTAVTSVANKGMTKSTKPHANTSVRIGSIFDTFASHSSDMATYAAWLGTSEDVNRIRNFVFWNDKSRVGTVKGILDTVHGTKGSAYIEKLLSDISIGVQGIDTMSPFDKLTGNYKAASVGANIRVIIQQPTAILRALDMIGAQHLTAGAYRPLKGWEKAKKYAPIAQWKDWGYFDINTGRQMKDVLFDNAGVVEKTKQIGMWGASMADSLAWGQLWNAVESETKAKHKDLEVGSNEYYEAVAKRFTEIVDHTQVVDGILQRSQIMRSTDNITKMATSFMGEPTKQYNMAISALHDAQTKKGEARKKAIAKLGRSAIALGIAGIVNACAQSIVDALRDDDKEEEYWEKWLNAFVGDGEDTKWHSSNLVETFNPVAYVPFAKDVLSIVQGYDVARMDTETISKTYIAAKNMYKAITGTGKYTTAEALANLFAEVGRLYGVPVANVKRDIKSIVMTFAIESDNYLMQYRIEKAMLDINYAGNSKNFMDILHNAYNNNKEAYEYIYNDLLIRYKADMIKQGIEFTEAEEKRGITEDVAAQERAERKIKSAMEERMMKAEGVSKAEELSKRYLAPDDEKKYDRSINRAKSSKVWASATEEQRKEAEADLYSFVTSTSQDMAEKREEARQIGIDETEYTLWQLAKEIANDDGKSALNKRERSAAVKLLDMDSDDEWKLYQFNYDNASAQYARDNGIECDVYADYYEALYEVDQNNKNGAVGSYDQKEARTAANSIEGISAKEKSILWKSTNKTWRKKRSPFGY